MNRYLALVLIMCCSKNYGYNKAPTFTYKIMYPLCNYLYVILIQQIIPKTYYIQGAVLAPLIQRGITYGSCPDREMC